MCPTAALTGISFTKKVWAALSDPSKKVIVQVAPAVRVAIGEEFGEEPGTDMTGKLVSGLKQIGFDAVFDTNFGADLTIMEEAHEFLERFKSMRICRFLPPVAPDGLTFWNFSFRT